MGRPVTGALILFVASLVLAVGALLALFARWVSRSWAVVEDEEPEAGKVPGSVWSWLLAWTGRGPRRLTYRRDERGRFRKHRR